MNVISTAITLAVATLASEDLAAIGAAILAGEGRVDIWTATAAVATGIYVGDVLLFASGRAGMRVRMLRSWLAARTTSDWRERFGARFDRHLVVAVLASRMVPGTRLPMYVAAGMWSRRPMAFCVWTLIGVLVWTPFLVLGVFFCGTLFASAATSYIKWAPGVALLLGFQLAVKAIAARRRM